MPRPASAKIPVEAEAEHPGQAGAQGTSFGTASHLEQHPARAAGAGNKVACSALEVLKMQMYRNFRPSPSLLLGAVESSLNTARPGEEC